MQQSYQNLKSVLQNIFKNQNCKKSFFSQASWHPLADLIAVGEYPDVVSDSRDMANVKATVAVYDAETAARKTTADFWECDLVTHNCFEEDGSHMLAASLCTGDLNLGTSFVAGQQLKNSKLFHLGSRKKCYSTTVFSIYTLLLFPDGFEFINNSSVYFLITVTLPGDYNITENDASSFCFTISFASFSAQDVWLFGVQHDGDDNGNNGDS